MKLAVLVTKTWKYKRCKLNTNSYSTVISPHNHVHNNIISTNIVITKNVKRGKFEVARKVFDEMPERSVVSWNAMISGYSKWGNLSEALCLFSAMHRSDTTFNESTFCTVLSVCARLPSLYDGKQVHCLVLKYGYEQFELVGSGLLYFYASCFEIDEARRVFDLLVERNELLWSLMLVGYVQCNLMDNAMDVFKAMPLRGVVEWTALISGYSKREDGCEKALELFKLMRGSGEAVPNEFTLDSVVRACGTLGLLHEGRVIHGLLIRYGFEFERLISGALIGFYCNCAAVDDAKKVFGRLVSPSLNDSNAIIGGLIVAGRVDEAEMIFNELVERNSVAYNLMINEYSLAGRTEDSEKLYLEMPQRTLVSTNTMISAYSRSGDLDKALDLFEQVKEERNPVTWNSMISGYVQNDKHEKALDLYRIMCNFSVTRTRATFSVLFHACSCLGTLQQGLLLHAHLIKTLFGSDTYVGAALVDMYSKCGSVVGAQASFMCILNPNVAAWTALINGYAHHGLAKDAILLFEHMINQEVRPNSATFVAILSACVHAGLVNEGMKFFYSMKESYGVTPTLEHFTRAVDLLGRSGRVREAEELINDMPVEGDNVIWGALLNACLFWMDMEVGERVAAKMFDMETVPVYVYVMMSNIYSVLGKWDEKMKVRKILRGKEVKKDPGRSWIEMNNVIHIFSVEDRNHPYCDLIYGTLEHLAENINGIAQLDIHSVPMIEA